MPLFPSEEGTPGAAGPGGSNGPSSSDGDADPGSSDGGFTGPGGASASGGPMQQAEAAMAGRKYRMVLGESVVPENPVFRFQSSNRDSAREVEALEFNGIYVVEIPMSIWTQATAPRLLVASADE